MGMYTELYLSVRLKKDIPAEVDQVLRHLFNEQIELDSLPKHEFFDCPRWECIGSMSSFYFAPESLSSYFSAGRSKFIISRSDLKNYDSEIEKFLNFLEPYIDAGVATHIGHVRYEEDRHPMILMYESTGIVWKEVT